MTRIEKKVIAFFNNYMLHIAMLLVLGTALLARYAARKYVGIDYDLYLKDVQGNVNSPLYGQMVAFLKSLTDQVPILLKFMAYAGDFAVAGLTYILLWKSGDKIFSLKTFYIMTVLLLSPILLIYSVVGMRLDAICMAMILFGVLCLKCKLPMLTVLCFAIASLLYPQYLIVSVVVCFLFMKDKAPSTAEIEKPAKSKSIMKRIGASYQPNGTLLHKSVLYTAKQKYACIAVTILLYLAVTVCLAQNILDALYSLVAPFISYYPAETTPNLLTWLENLILRFGYIAALGSLLAALTNKKWRVPAIIIQLALLFIVGWYQTHLFAV